MMKSATVTRGWPPARREAQAERAKAAKPWLRSTGPRTAEGKAKAARNAFKHGFRSGPMARLKALLRDQRRFMKALVLPTEWRRKPVYAASSDIERSREANPGTGTPRPFP
jgi:hypothetical protein